jgi:hypothetical protein
LPALLHNVATATQSAPKIAVVFETRRECAPIAAPLSLPANPGSRF